MKTKLIGYVFFAGLLASSAYTSICPAPERLAIALFFFAINAWSLYLNHERDETAQAASFDSARAVGMAKEAFAAIKVMDGEITELKAKISKFSMLNIR